MKFIFPTLIFAILFASACKKTVETKPVVNDIKELVFASGQLEWDDSYNLVAQTDGILMSAKFEIGQEVKKGIVYAVLDNRTSQINTEVADELLGIAKENLKPSAPQLLQIDQNIQIAENKYQQDKLQADRYQRLFDKGSVAKIEMENMQLAAKNSLANLNALNKQKSSILQQSKSQEISIRGQLKNARTVQNYNQIKVPETGTIIKKLKNDGDFVRRGEVVAVIADQSNVEGVLNIDENSIGKIKIRQTAYIQLNTDKNKVYEAKITEILSAFDQLSQSFICKVKFKDSLALKYHGTQLEANILIGEKKNALLIPRKMLGYGNKVNVKGIDSPVVIKPGIISTEYVEVLEGITKEDIILPLGH